MIKFAWRVCTGGDIVVFSFCLQFSLHDRLRFCLHGDWNHRSQLKLSYAFAYGTNKLCHWPIVIGCVWVFFFKKNSLCWRWEQKYFFKTSYLASSSTWRIFYIEESRLYENKILIICICLCNFSFFPLQHTVFFSSFHKLKKIKKIGAFFAGQFVW